MIYQLQYRSINPPRILQCGWTGKSLITHSARNFRARSDLMALLHVQNIETEWYEAQCSNGNRAPRRLSEKLVALDATGKEIREVQVYIKTESASE